MGMFLEKEIRLNYFISPFIGTTVLVYVKVIVIVLRSLILGLNAGLVFVSNLHNYVTKHFIKPNIILSDALIHFVNCR